MDLIKIEKIDDDNMVVDSPNFYSTANSTATNTTDLKKKKGASLNNSSEELCLICGDRSSGFHYNAYVWILNLINLIRFNYVEF